MTDSTTELKTVENTTDLVSTFIQGEDSQLSTGASFTAGGTLFADKDTAIAKRIPDGSVMLFTPSNIRKFADLNDTLLVGLATASTSFTRANDTLENVLSPTKVLALLDSGEFNQFKQFAPIIGLDVSEEDIATIRNGKALQGKFTEFFKDKAEVERLHRLAAQAAAIKDAEKQRYESWDAGEGTSSNYQIRGAGNNGYRLRLRVTPGGMRKVQTSNGNEMAITTALRVWKSAVKYWFENVSSAYRFSTSSYDVRISHTDVNYGCQSTTRAEVERFADKMGWPRTSAELENFTESRTVNRR